MTITIKAIEKCSNITLHLLHPCPREICRLKIHNADNPQITATIIAFCSSKSKTGIRNERANMNLKKNVEIVDCQISLSVCLLSDSSDICMPKASEKASATAIVRIPPRTAIFKCVPECRPTINPRVVIMPEVIPKLSPILSE